MNIIKDKQINDYLSKYDLGHAYLGYTYLMEAVRLQLDEVTPRGKIRSTYEVIASKHNTRVEYVDRLVRDAMKKAGIQTKPKHFITQAVDELRFGAE